MADINAVKLYNIDSIDSVEWGINHQVDISKAMFTVTANGSLCFEITYKYNEEELEYRLEEIIKHFAQNINKKDKFYFPESNIQFDNDEYTVLIANENYEEGGLSSICIQLNKEIFQVIIAEINIFHEQFKRYYNQLKREMEMVKNIKILCQKIEKKCDINIQYHSLHFAIVDFKKELEKILEQLQIINM